MPTTKNLKFGDIVKINKGVLYSSNFYNSFAKLIKEKINAIVLKDVDETKIIGEIKILNLKDNEIYFCSTINFKKLT